MVLPKREGLFYCVIRRPKLPAIPALGLPELPALPDTATAEEIRDNFKAFCQDGFPIPGDGFRPDDKGRSMNGTLRWLAGYEITDANFYVTLKPTLMFFVSLVVKLGDPTGPDWTKQPGFMMFVKQGEVKMDIGKSDNKLDSLPDLDMALAEIGKDVQKVSEKNRPRLLEALKGEKIIDGAAPNLKLVLEEIQNEESITLPTLI